MSIWVFQCIYSRKSSVKQTDLFDIGHCHKPELGQLTGKCCLLYHQEGPELSSFRSFFALSLPSISAGSENLVGRFCFSRSLGPSGSASMGGGAFLHCILLLGPTCVDWATETMLLALHVQALTQ